jgi:hypothetical protein
MIAWVYGSGFPKSHNVSVSIDKLHGHGNRGKAIPTASSYQASDVDQENKLTSNPVPPYEAKSDDAKKWEGWGSALKPSMEMITVAAKPSTSKTERDIIVYNLRLLEEKLWLLLHANAVQKNFDASHPELKKALSFVRWSAENVFSTLDGLYDLTDTLLLESALTSSSNIVSSWKSTLEEHSVLESTFTTGMESSTIIDWRTLKSLVLKITPGCIVAESLNRVGSTVNAPIAVKRFDAYVSLLKNIQTLSVTEDAMSQTKDLLSGDNISPSLEPITVARKPLIGTIAKNVLEYGTGGMNIDACRVPMDADDYEKLSKGVDQIRQRGGVMDNSWKNSSDLSGANPANPLGRWPANFIHDGSQQVLDLFPNTKGGSWVRTDGARHFNNDGKPTGYVRSGQTDSSIGSAARFFYCSKSGKKDRDLEEHGNIHPTVKPTDLMGYLCRLVTQPGGTVLDPFMGSGTTGKAAMLDGFEFIGCEMDEQYYKIAEARIRHALER